MPTVTDNERDAGSENEDAKERAGAAQKEGGSATWFPFVEFSELD
ncbi:hypothetical protein HCH_03959 [Hahella chejuensis KCTC 2396]|uniref:Uncharacterized protein n=1 Tax=Hahella chejuensis (strain KCTC 2396) TaxID=349521 RepID=Q2SF96_HAHCH|nr:hypothetical protein HCH_03959 [Hahella chejuensis KCTC 2396]